MWAPVMLVPIPEMVMVTVRLVCVGSRVTVAVPNPVAVVGGFSCPGVRTAPKVCPKTAPAKASRSRVIRANGENLGIGTSILSSAFVWISRSRPVDPLASPTFAIENFCK